MSQGDNITPHTNMNNLNQMTNLAMGGVQVPGGMPNMVQAQQGAMVNGVQQKGLERSLLNTYIYDYFIRHHMYDSARAILNEADVATEANSSVRRQSPSRRAQKHDSDGNLINGLDDSMDTDRKEDVENDERAENLPLPKVPQDSSGGSFLYDWWSLFWDIFGARTGKNVTGAAMTYVTQVQAKNREEQQRRLLSMGAAGGFMTGGQMPVQMMPGYPNQMVRAANGVMHPDDSARNQKNFARSVMVANAGKQQSLVQNPNMQLQQMKNAQQQHQMMQQQQMQRDQSVDGERPQSPAPGQNGSSPSKRPRIEGEFQAGNGRGQLRDMQNAQVAQTQQMLLQNGINPQQLTPAQFAHFQNNSQGVQQKAISAYAQNLRMHQQNAMGQNPAVAKGMIQNSQMGAVSAAQGTPMMHQTSGDGGPGNINDFYNGGAGMGRGMNATEQDQIHMRGNEPRADGSVPFQSMSPSGTRAAPSPQPSQDIKRGTPKMPTAPGPGSPLPADGQIQIQRGSPAASIAAFNGQPTVPNAAMMRPPSSHPGFAGMPHIPDQMNPMLRQQQAGRGQPGQLWAGNVPVNAGQAAQAAAAQQQMAALQAQHQAQQAQAQAQQQGQPQVAPSPATSAGQPQNIGTPGQTRPNGPHQNMPPPSAPPANTAAGRTSPQVNNAMPPTPTTTNKATAARNKKDAKEPRKPSRPSKKAATAATANAGASAPTPSDAETPAPETPMTPQNPASFNSGANVGKVPAATFANTAVPTVGGAASEAAPQATTTAPIGPTDTSQNPNFSTIDDFGSMTGFGDSEGLLPDFDFDSFLNTDHNAGNFDFSMDFGGLDGDALGDP